MHPSVGIFWHIPTGIKIRSQRNIVHHRVYHKNWHMEAILIFMSGWMNVYKVIHVKEYSAVFQNKEIPSFETVWLNLDTIMLNEWNETEKY